MLLVSYISTQWGIWERFTGWDPMIWWGYKYLYRPYSEQCHDRYESEAVRDRLTVFPMASPVKS